MQAQSIKLNPDGTLKLPDELRETLKGISDLTISWDEQIIVIEIKSNLLTNQSMSKEEKIKRFFESADKLQQFNQIEPITEEEIQAEIEAYRLEKHSHSSSL